MTLSDLERLMQMVKIIRRISIITLVLWFDLECRIWYGNTGGGEAMFVGVSHALRSKGRGPSVPEIFWTSYARAQFEKQPNFALRSN